MKKVDYFGLWQNTKSRPKLSFNKEKILENEINSQRERRQKAAHNDLIQSEVAIQRRAEITTNMDELKRLTSTKALHMSHLSESDTLIRRDELMHAKKVLSEF